MRDIHPIRLRGPWHFEPIARLAYQVDGSLLETTADLPAAGRVKMPCRWDETLGESFSGQVRFSRHFGCPTALEPHETVWLVIEAMDASGQALLNGAPLGELKPNEPTRFNVTGLLGQRNELVLDLNAPHPPAAPVGEVRLEVHGVEHGG